MNRLELLGRPTQRQLIADEVARFLQPRQEKLQRLIVLDEQLLPEERARLTVIESELSALASVVADELCNLDTKLTTTQKAIDLAKAQG